MTAIRRAMMLGTAAALVTLSLALPASAGEDATRSAARMTDVSSAEVPLPKARPALVRKRFAFRAPAYIRPMVWRLPAYERTVVRWSMLMLGVGF